MIQILMPSHIDDNRIGSSFNHLFSIINEIEKNEDNDIEFDFSSTKILNPFFLLPLLLYKKNSGKNISYSNIPTLVSRYFDTIHFYKELDAENENDFHGYMEQFSEKRYIPIIKFPASKCKDDIKNEILGIIGNLLKRQLMLSGNVYMALNYFLSELIDNITEHSHSKYGYIFAQYYPKSRYVDICIADEGITILGSYIKNKNAYITTDIEAIRKASVGVSTKNLPDAENRGYGIVTSKTMLSEGLKGNFFLFSGGAFFRKSESEEIFVDLPDNIKWDGTIILLRIPYSSNDNFDFYKYLEV